MPTRISDVFSDKDAVVLSDHVPEQGSVWKQHPVFNTRTFDIRSNRVRGVGTSGTAQYLNLATIGKDQNVKGTVRILTKLSGDFPGIVGRWDATANTGYVARFNMTSDLVELLEIINGTATTTSAAFAVTAGNSYVLELDVIDGNKRILVDSVEKINLATNNIAGPGFAGLRHSLTGSSSTTTGGHVDTFVVVDNTAEPTPTTASPIIVGSYVRQPPKPYQITEMPETLCGHKLFNSVSYNIEHLWTYNGVQYTSWVDSTRKIKVSKRTLPNGTWSTADLSTVASNPLASPTDSDEHNVASLAVSTDGHIHVWANMHAQPLRYVKTSVAGDITSFASASMSGVNQTQVSYPMPVKGKNDGLLCFYRDGVSGNADYFLDTYNASTHTWSSVGKILNGKTSTENPYPSRVCRAPNGDIHMFYVWRGAGSSDLTNDVCHIKSSDNGTTWTDIAGNALTLPITHATSPLLLDTAASGSGLFNTAGADVDTAGRPHAAFHLYDGSSQTQIYHFWHDGSAWHQDLVTSLTYHWDLAGSIVERHLSRPDVVCGADGKTYIIYRTNKDNQRGKFTIVDVTPGATQTSRVLWRTDTHYAEQVHDHQALKDRDELHVLFCPSAPTDSASTDWMYSASWQTTPAYIYTIPMRLITSLS